MLQQPQIKQSLNASEKKEKKSHGSPLTGAFKIRRSMQGQKLLISRESIRNGGNEVNTEIKLREKATVEKAIKISNGEYNGIRNVSANSSDFISKEVKNNSQVNLDIKNQTQSIKKENQSISLQKNDRLENQKNNLKNYKNLKNLNSNSEKSKIRSEVMVLDFLQREFDRDITFDKRSFTERFVYSLKKRKDRNDLVSLGIFKSFIRF